MTPKINGHPVHVTMRVDNADNPKWIGAYVETYVMDEPHLTFYSTGIMSIHEFDDFELAQSILSHQAHEWILANKDSEESS